MNIKVKSPTKFFPTKFTAKMPSLGIRAGLKKGLSKAGGMISKKPIGPPPFSCVQRVNYNPESARQLNPPSPPAATSRPP
jgi:hypothetical protein